MAATKKNLTFRQMCAERKEMRTPWQQFVSEIAQVTCRAENTVIAWSKGQYAPDILAQQRIAEYLDSDVETLFPCENGG